MALRHALTTSGLGLLIAVAAAGPAAAQTVPGLLTLSARIDNSGTPLSGAHNFDFKLFTAPTGGTMVWQEADNNVSATNGLVFVELGAVTTIDPSVLTGVKLFLDITIDGTPMTSRLPIDSVPYSLRADVAGQLGPSGFGGNGTATTVSHSDHNHSGVYLAQGTSLACGGGSVVTAIDTAGNVVCSAGTPGPTGPSGPVGATGATGPVGTAGAPGTVGATGPMGPQGVVGPTGGVGPAGVQGVPGVTGPTGSANAFTFVSHVLYGGIQAAGPTVYLDEASSGPTLANHQVVIPTNCTIDSIYVANAEAGGVQTYTVMVNGTATFMSCSTVVGGLGCNASGGVAANAGDLMTVQYTGNPGGALHGTVSVHCH
jgi:hypothetical protein